MSSSDLRDPDLSTQPRIAIVGAGIAGLTAALALTDAGLQDVTLYEASDRVGGRIWTNDGLWGDGQWSEWGGELVDTKHELVHALCACFAIPLVDLWDGRPPEAHDTLYFGGGYYGWEEMRADWQAAGLDAALAADVATLPADWTYDADWSPAAQALDEMSAYEWIEARVPGGHSSRLGQFIDVAYTGEYGEDSERQGAADLIGLLGYADPEQPFYILGCSDERWRVQGGNQRLVESMAEAIGLERLALGHELAGLRQERDEAVLSFEDGSEIRADYVVLTLPLGVLKRMAAEGALDELLSDSPAGRRKLASIAALGFGANCKLQLQISDRFWVGPGPWGHSSGQAFADTGFQNVWETSSGQPGRRGILNDYTGGSPARAFRPQQPFSGSDDPDPAVRAELARYVQAFLATAEPVYPGLSERFTGRAALAAWHLSPYQLGSYSYWTPGYLHRFAGCEAEPVGRVHFAGEHTSLEEQGYIEGAAQEGQRAAEEIIALCAERHA